MRTVSPSSRLEVVIGRSVAACVHPRAAWRMGAKGQVPILVGYFLAGYLLVLAALLSVWAPQV